MDFVINLNIVDFDVRHARSLSKMLATNPSAESLVSLQGEIYGRHYKVSWPCGPPPRMFSDSSDPQCP
jgi:hypothetical protein